MGLRQHIIRGSRPPKKTPLHTASKPSLPVARTEPPPPPPLQRRSRMPRLLVIAAFSGLVVVALVVWFLRGGEPEVPFIAIALPPQPAASPPPPAEPPKTAATDETKVEVLPPQPAEPQTIAATDETKAEAPPPPAEPPKTGATDETKVEALPPQPAELQTIATTEDEAEPPPVAVPALTAPPAQVAEPVEAPPEIKEPPATVTKPPTHEAAVSTPAMALPPKPTRLEPDMIHVQGGTFSMGSIDDPSERPVHSVTVATFWLAKFPVTVKEWKLCLEQAACSLMPSGEDDAPVTNVSWTDAQQYVTWLSGLTGKKYRLPSEAEWEFAARGGSETKFWWGSAAMTGMANCKGCGEPYDPHQPVKVGSFKANGFGLYDMSGGVAQWVADCWHHSYRGAPKNGVEWDAPNCRQRVLRGGSWRDEPAALRVSNREQYDADVRYPTHGLRVALTP
jgi:formylglycine-generating enzyme required for sulfatase activity